MQRYESYKASGVEWLGDIPSHWEVRPGFTCFKENKDRNKGLIEKTVLSLSYGRIVIKPEEKLTGLVPESFESYQRIKPGDIVIRTTDLQNDHTSLRVGLAKNNGMITSAYLGLRCNHDLNPNYIFRVLESYDALKIFYGMGSGLRQNIDFWDFKRLPIPIPPRAERDRIVNFLDQKTAEIEAAIAKKQRLIELLQEQKSILINQAVTRGLNPNAPMRDSGVEWIGEIPAHWETSRLKFLFKNIEQGWSPQCFNFESSGDSWGVLKVGCVNGSIFNERENKQLPPELKPITSLQIRAGDILISRANSLELVGSAAYVYECERKLMLCDKIYRVHAQQDRVIPEYLVLMVRTKLVRQWIENGANGASPSMQNISQDVIKNILVAVPPINEQQTILKMIGRFEADAKVLTEKIKMQIDTLLELKTTLISEVVTGKIKALEM